MSRAVGVRVSLSPESNTFCFFSRLTSRGLKQPINNLVRQENGWKSINNSVTTGGFFSPRARSCIALEPANPPVLQATTGPNQQMQSNTAVPTVDIPKPRRFKVVFVNIWNKQGKFPQIPLKATITKIQRWEHKMAKLTATEWKEISSAKATSHGLITCLHLSHVLLVTVPVYWPWHAPAKIKRGGTYNRAQDNQLQKATG